MKSFIRSFRNIRVKPLLSVVIPMLLIPLLLGLVQAKDGYNRMRIFSDVLLIESLVLVITGVVLSFINHGDLDITLYKLKGAFKEQKPYSVYKEDRDAQHRAAFNYPLFLGLCGLIVSTVLAFLL